LNQTNNPNHRDVPKLNTSTIGAQKEPKNEQVHDFRRGCDQVAVGLFHSSPQTVPTHGGCEETPNGPKDWHPNEAAEQDDADFAPNRVCGLPSMLEVVVHGVTIVVHVGRCCESMHDAGSKHLF
jgi:hypothetical protein